MQTTKQKIDLEVLPEEARKKMIDFYELLIKKYKTKTKNELADDVDKFFDRYNLELTSFKFDREKAHER